MSSVNVLIVDEDDAFLAELREIFEGDSLFQVMGCNSFDKAQEILQSEPFQILLTELIFANHDGVELIDYVRKQLKSNMLVAVLTGVRDQYSQVTVLNHGADDFYQKPMNHRLLRTRLAALTRRLRYQAKGEIKEIGDVQIDYERFLVIRNESKIELQKKEFEIVDLLANSPDKVFTREEIKKQLWDDFDEVRNRTIDVHIRKLRSKLGDDFIHTIKGVGYRF
jgi:two-component system alkaline phosphatase synthesis response regulator PhoP